MAAADILIIDDEAEFSNVVAERLRNRDFAVDTAQSGLEGIGMAENKAYDAVILDLAMPEMDGIETLKRLLAIDKNLQIILLTGHATVQTGIEAMKLGAADFLEKPADIGMLLGKVTEAHEKRVEAFQESLDKKVSDIMKKKGW